VIEIAPIDASRQVSACADTQVGEGRPLAAGPKGWLSVSAWTVTRNLLLEQFVKVQHPLAGR